MKAYVAPTMASLAMTDKKEFSSNLRKAFAKKGKRQARQNAKAEIRRAIYS